MQESTPCIVPCTSSTSRSRSWIISSTLYAWCEVIAALDHKGIECESAAKVILLYSISQQSRAGAIGEEGTNHHEDMATDAGHVHETYFRHRYADEDHHHGRKAEVTYETVRMKMLCESSRNGPRLDTRQERVPTAVERTIRAKSVTWSTPRLTGVSSIHPQAQVVQWELVLSGKPILQERAALQRHTTSQQLTRGEKGRRVHRAQRQ